MCAWLPTCFLRAGQNVQASQEYVSSKMSWFTGGFFLQLFQVDSSYGVAYGILQLNVIVSEPDKYLSFTSLQHDSYITRVL